MACWALLVLENFVGAASWSQVSFHWNVMCPFTPLDLPAVKALLLDVLEVVLSQGGGDFANSHSSQFIWAGPYTIFRFRISNHMSFTHTISSRMTHKVLMCIHKHHHGTPSGCPHKRILHILATTSPPCPMIHSLGAHWVLTWLLTWLLTYYSLDYSLGTHLVLTWYSLGAHWVLIGCSLGAHWVLIDPTWQPGHDASTELHHSSQQWKTCISLQRGIKK